jgi:catechol 2,3-dioxygenase-like lactoylglutathione lyase family enzyme
MFADRHATVMLPARDVDRAVRWYDEKLGIKPAERLDYGVRYKLDGASDVFLYQTQFAGTAQNTMLSFDSDDLVADMQAMREKGVTFLDYDLPGIKTVDGMVDFGGVKNAWCKDSEGNILGFVQGM